MDESQALVVRATDVETVEFDWGRIEFFADRDTGPAHEQSVGRATIFPGKGTPRHYHPNCSEIVHVLQGSILHTLHGEEETTLGAGDTVIVPRNLVHRAFNPGTENAVLGISFSASRREFVVV